MIAGAFMYQYGTVVTVRPNVYVRGVDNSQTQVDSILRVMVSLPDGDHCVQEVLICNSFELALWSTEYMGCFGFSHLLMPSDTPSVVRTPSGCEVKLGRRPYTLLAPCRAPSATEFTSGKVGVPAMVANQTTPPSSQ